MLLSSFIISKYSSWLDSRLLLTTLTMSVFAATRVEASISIRRNPIEYFFGLIPSLKKTAFILLYLFL